MPDGYGDGMPQWAIDRVTAPSHACVSPTIALSAVARLCRTIGMNKKSTLEILGLTKSRENYQWLEHVTGQGGGAP